MLQKIGFVSVLLILLLSCGEKEVQQEEVLEPKSVTNEELIESPKNSEVKSKKLFTDALAGKLKESKIEEAILSLSKDFSDDDQQNIAKAFIKDSKKTFLSKNSRTFLFKLLLASEEKLGNRLLTSGNPVVPYMNLPFTIENEVDKVYDKGDVKPILMFNASYTQVAQKRMREYQTTDSKSSKKGLYLARMVFYPKSLDPVTYFVVLEIGGQLQIRLLPEMVSKLTETDAEAKKIFHALDLTWLCLPEDYFIKERVDFESILAFQKKFPKFVYNDYISGKATSLLTSGLKEEVELSSKQLLDCLELSKISESGANWGVAKLAYSNKSEKVELIQKALNLKFSPLPKDIKVIVPQAKYKVKEDKILHFKWPKKSKFTHDFRIVYQNVNGRKSSFLYGHSGSGSKTLRILKIRNWLKRPGTHNVELLISHKGKFYITPTVTFVVE